MLLTPAQCRAARALISWSQDQLAAASKVAKATIANFEAAKREPYDRTLTDIQRALEAAGVEFTNGGQPGVRMRREESHEELTKQIEALKDAHPPVDHAEPTRPQKAMHQLNHAHAKNEIVKLKNRRAKHPKGK